MCAEELAYYQRNSHAQISRLDLMDFQRYKWFLNYNKIREEHLCAVPLAKLPLSTKSFVQLCKIPTNQAEFTTVFDLDIIST